MRTEVDWINIFAIAYGKETQMFAVIYTPACFGPEGMGGLYGMLQPQVHL
jgi:hypothetical protein